jgi:uncharacterized protein DUF4178
MTEASCPSCGAKVTFRSSASVFAVCEYCKSTLVRHDVDVEALGRMADLKADGSPLQLGATGAYRGVHFAAVGRIQYRFPQGLWNEWYLLFDDMRGGWLGEARGNYAVSFVEPVAEPIPPFDKLAAGAAVMLDGVAFEVVDVQKAQCIAGEGELPFRVGAGYEAPVADLQGPGRRFATIDYSEDEPLVFLGEYVEFEQLALSGLRVFDGW